MDYKVVEDRFFGGFIVGLVVLVNLISLVGVWVSWVD